MSITASFDLKALERELDAVRKKQLPFALALAINASVKSGQEAMRAKVRRDFTIAPKRLAFMERLIRFPKHQQARKDRLAAVISIGEADVPWSARKGAAKDRQFLLGRHETGGVRTAPDPDEPFFLPTKALRAGAYDVPPMKSYPRALRLYARRDPSGVLPGKSRLTKRGKVQRQGKRRAFIVTSNTRFGGLTGGIYERYGPKQRQIRKLWTFKRTITLKPRLGFYRTVQGAIDTTFDRHFAEAMARAVATAR